MTSRFPSGRRRNPPNPVRFRRRRKDLRRQIGLPGAAQSLDFVVPSTKSKTARVRVVIRDAAGNSAQDDGDADFSIKVKK